MAEVIVARKGGLVRNYRRVYVRENVTSGPV
jgi:hypothetical protein